MSRRVGGSTNVQIGAALLLGALGLAVAYQLVTWAYSKVNGELLVKEVEQHLGGVQ